MVMLRKEAFFVTNIEAEFPQPHQLKPTYTRTRLSKEQQPGTHSASASDGENANLSALMSRNRPNSCPISMKVGERLFQSPTQVKIQVARI
jgi:hypothetical protein